MAYFYSKVPVPLEITELCLSGRSLAVTDYILLCRQIYFSQRRVMKIPSLVRRRNLIRHPEGLFLYLCIHDRSRTAAGTGLSLSS